MAFAAVAGIGQEESSNPYERYMQAYEAAGGYGMNAGHRPQFTPVLPGASQDTSGDGKVKINPEESDVKKAGMKSSPSECKTCKERKYQDGSNEADVSFKSAAHISVGSAGAMVRAHEQQHVANAYEKAEKGNGKVLQASVTIHTAVCPECGTSYVSGGETNTKIAYPRDGQKHKSPDGIGNHFDASA